MFSVRRFGKGMRKLSLSNHGQWIEDYVFDYFLKETEPDCSLYAKDGTEKKIHKVSDLKGRRLRGNDIGTGSRTKFR